MGACEELQEEDGHLAGGRHTETREVMTEGEDRADKMETGGTWSRRSQIGPRPQEVRELGAEVEPLGLRAEAESDCVHIIQVCLVIKLVTPLFKSRSVLSVFVKSTSTCSCVSSRFL